MAATIPVMTATRDLWSEAAATLDKKDKESLDIENLGRENFSSAVLEMVTRKKTECDNKRWSFSFGGERRLVSDVMGNILKWTKKFEGLGDYVVGLDVSGHAAIPWAAIKFFIDLASKDYEKYGSMLVGMEFVTSEIRFYRIFEVVYFKKRSNAVEELAQTLVKTYAKLLGYLAKAKRFYSESAFKRLIKDYFEDGGVVQMKSDIEEARSHIEQNAHLVDKEELDEGVNLIHDEQRDLKKELEGFKAPLEKISVQLAAISTANTIAKRKEILNWISPIPYLDHHKGAREGRLESTGLWLLNHNEFNEWKSSSAFSTLWLHGIPGSGKTKLSSLVVDNLRDGVNQNLDPVAYFYCTRDTAEPKRADPAEILKCIARQLADNTTAATIRPAAASMYEELTEGGVQSNHLDLEQCTRLIADLTKELASMTIVIDALDECENKFDLLDSLCKIQLANIPIRIFVASRYERAISAWIKNFPRKGIEIEMGDNAEDIGLFIRTEVDHAISSKKLLAGEISPESKQRIIDTLIAGAQGMFRWASLQLQSLTKLKQEETVLKELSQLPSELSDIYAKIYEQMSESDAFETAAKALRFITCIQKPMETRPFLAAVCTQKPIDSESLVDYCSNLILEDKSLGTFRFAHLSVREYLEEKRTDYTPVDTHAVAAEICLACISKRRPGNRGTMAGQESAQSSDAMREYATMFWPVHCQLSGEKRANPHLASLISSFIMQRRTGLAFSKWMEDARALTESLKADDPLRKKFRHCLCSPPNPFFLGCAFGLSEVVKHSDMSVMARSELGLSGLHLASFYGHEQVVRILLGKGATADSKDTYGRTPLFYATENGHLRVVEVLLEYGKDVKISSEILQLGAWAWERGKQSKGIMELLLRKDGKIYISDDVLLAAVMAPTKDLIEFLWNLPDQEIQISVWLFNLAAWANSTEVLEFLLDKVEFEASTQTLCEVLNNYKPENKTLEFILQYYNETQFPESVIMAAASMGGLQAFKILLDDGREMKIYQDAFEAAASNSSGGVELIEFLRSQNTGLQITPTMLCSAAGNSDHEHALQLIQYLHSEKPEADLTDDVVRKAVLCGNEDLLEYLLGTMKQLEVTRELIEAAAGGRVSIKLVGRLLDSNPEVQVDEELISIAAPYAENTAIMASLINRAKDCPVTERIVLAAAKTSLPEVVEFLITKSPDLRITDTTILAVMRGRLDGNFAEELLEVFCNHAKDFKPTEEISIEAANSAIGRVFLGYLINRYGHVPITEAVWMAAARSRSGSLELLLDQDFQPQGLEVIIATTAMLGSHDDVDLLLRRFREELDSAKWLGIANLSQAIRDGNVEKAQELISSGIWPETGYWKLGWAPLISNVRNMGNAEMVKVLLETRRVDLETRDENGKTALCWAAQQGREDLMKILLENGADWSVADFNNMTPMILAMTHGYPGACEVLRQWEAKDKLENVAGCV